MSVIREIGQARMEGASYALCLIFMQTVFLIIISKTAVTLVSNVFSFTAHFSHLSTTKVQL